MFMHMTVTETTNVDCAIGRVINHEKVKTLVKDWNEVVDVYDVVRQERQTVPMHSISLYDHRLIEQQESGEEVQHHILHALSRSERN